MSVAAKSDQLQFGQAIEDVMRLPVNKDLALPRLVAAAFSAIRAGIFFFFFFFFFFALSHVQAKRRACYWCLVPKRVWLKRRAF
jgi:hypothetical protein